MSNHNGNANKMVSDTPRTDAEMVEMTTGDGPVKTRTKWVHSSVCIQLERELNAANAKIKELEEWKRSALEVEREWNANAIATMLGGKLGESQREVIQREVPKLLARIKRLEEAGDAMATWLSDPRNLGDDPFMSSQWQKAKEAKP